VFIIGELMKFKLDDIAEIKTGYTFRNGLKKYPNGKLGVIQMKDLKEFDIDLQNIDYITDDSIGSNHCLSKNDIIIKTRGEQNTSYILEEEINAVASAPLLVLKVKTKTVIPGYLYWYLNQKPAKEHYNLIAKGTLQKIISINNLKDMEIEVPPLKIQQLIVDIDTLSRREKELTEELYNKKEAVITAKLFNIITGEKR